MENWKLELTPKSLAQVQENPELLDEILNNLSQREEDASSIIECENPDANYVDGKTVWVDAAIKLLLASVDELRPQVGKSIKLKNKKKMWEVIQGKLCEAGYDFTVLQIENKYRGLERNFKRVKNHNNKTGRDRKSCPYEKELQEILCDKPSVFPEIIVGSKNNDVLRRDDLIAASTSDESTPNSCGNNSNDGFLFQTRKTRQTDIVKELKELKDDRRKFHEDVMKIIRECHEEKLEILRRRNELLERLMN